MSDLKQQISVNECMTFDEQEWAPIFCKPKLLPMKTYTMEKLQQMQKEAELQMKALDEQAETEEHMQEEIDQQSPRSLSPDEGRQVQNQTDVWSADD